MTDEAAEFVGFFTEGFALGGAGHAKVVDHFLPRVRSDVVLNQPFARPARGHAGFRRVFEALFTTVPDLRIDISRWGATDDGVLIEFVARGTLGGRQIEMPIVDRFSLTDGCVRQRDTYCNPLLVVHPVTAWSLAHPMRAAKAAAKLLTTDSITVGTPSHR
jgi:ketosteroid isomerase-like protein